MRAQKQQNFSAYQPLESLDTEVDDDAEEAWDAEIAKRLDEINSGKVKMIPWSEARRQIMGTNGDRQKR